MLKGEFLYIFNQILYNTYDINKSNVDFFFLTIGLFEIILSWYNKKHCLVGWESSLDLFNCDKI